MNDVEVLARTLYGEARFNDVEDAEAIANVVLNRVGYRNWPNSVSKVCLQPWQFSCWLQHDEAHAANFIRLMSAQRGNQWFDRCWNIAERAVAGELTDTTRTSTHYHTREVSPKWSRNKIPVFETKGHVFFNNIDTPAPNSSTAVLNEERPLTESRTMKTGVVAIVASVVGAVYENAGEVIQESVTAVAPLSSLFSGTDVKSIVIGIMTAGVIFMMYARWDDRNKGKR